MQDATVRSIVDSWIDSKLTTILASAAAETSANQEGIETYTSTDSESNTTGELTQHLQHLLTEAFSAESEPASALTVLTARSLVVDLSPTEEDFYSDSAKEQQFLLLEAREKQQVLENRLEIEERKTMLMNQNTQLRREQEMIDAFAEELERHRSEIDIIATQVDSKTQQLRDRIHQQLDELQSQIHHRWTSFGRI